MRLLYVTPRFAPLVGGAETHVREVATRLALRGHEVRVLTCDAGLNLPAHESLDGFEVERIRAWPRGRDYYFAPALYSKIASSGADVVHVHNYHTFVAPLAMLAARLTGIPYVLTFHSGGNSSRLRRSIRGPQLLALRPLLAGAARLVAVSDFELAWLRRSLRFGAHRFAVIPNGSDLLLKEVTDPEALGPSPSEALDPAKDAPLILSVGRLEKYKGHQRVLEALPGVIARYPLARLRIAGWGPYEATLRSRAQELGLGDRVEIGGVPADDREAMVDLFRRAAAVTLLSDYEAHPIAALEAGALCRPLVVSGAGAYDDFVARGLAIRAGAGDPEVVSAAIVACLRGEFRPTGRSELWSWDRTAAALLQIYESVARTGAPAAESAVPA